MTNIYPEFAHIDDIFLVIHLFVTFVWCTIKTNHPLLIISSLYWSHLSWIFNVFLQCCRTHPPPSNLINLSDCGNPSFITK